MNRRAALLLCAAALGGPLQAQGPDSPPQIQRQRDVSGLRLLRFPGSGDAFTLVAVVAAGRRHEPAELPGLARFTQDVLLRSTKDRSWRRLERELASAGAEFRGACHSDVSTYAIQIPAAAWATAVTWLGECLTAPGLREEDVEAVRRLLLSEARERRWTLTREADARARAMYGDHDLGRPHHLDAEALRRIRRVDLQRFLDNWYCGNRCLVAFAGSPAPEATTAALLRAMQGLKPMQLPRPAAPPVPARSGGLRAAAQGSRERSLDYDGGYHVQASLPGDLLHLKVLERYLRRRLTREAQGERQLSHRVQVRLIAHPDAQRLELFAVVRDPTGFDKMHNLVESLAIDCRAPGDKAFAAARQGLLHSLRVRRLDDLIANAHFAWLYESFEASASELPAAIQGLEASRTGEFAAARLRPSHRFWIQAPEAPGSSWPWYLLLGVLVLLSLDGRRGFPWLRRHFSRQHPTVPDQVAADQVSPEPTPTEPRVTGDQLEESIQRWFAEQDRGD